MGGQTAAESLPGDFPGVTGSNRFWNRSPCHGTGPYESGGVWAPPGGHRAGKAQHPPRRQPVVPGGIHSLAFVDPWPYALSHCPPTPLDPAEADRQIPNEKSFSLAQLTMDGNRLHVNIGAED